MTKNDVIGLTVFFFAIMIIFCLVPISALMVFLFGWSWLSILLLMLPGLLIGSAVNGVIYAAIIYVLLSIFVGENKRKKENGKDTKVLALFIAALILVSGCTILDKELTEEDYAEILESGNYTKMQETKRPIHCSGLLPDAQATYELYLLNGKLLYNATFYPSGDYYVPDGMGFDSSGTTVSTVYLGSIKYEFLPLQGKACPWKKIDLGELEA